MSLTYLENRHNIHNTPWTPESVELLMVLWGQGYSASQIAAQLNGGTFTRNAVIGKASRLGLSGRTPRQPALRKPYHRRANGVPKPPTPPPQPKPPPPPPPPGLHEMRRLTVFELEPHHCRWPLGALHERARLFCAADTDGDVYCPCHMRAAARS